MPSDGAVLKGRWGVPGLNWSQPWMKDAPKSTWRNSVVHTIPSSALRAEEGEQSAQRQHTRPHLSSLRHRPCVHAAADSITCFEHEHTHAAALHHLRKPDQRIRHRARAQRDADASTKEPRGAAQAVG